MRKILWIAGVCISAMTGVAHAKPVPAPPQLAAKSYIMMDANSGQIIVEYNSEKQLPPASLTKLMTSYIVERELADGTLSWDEPVEISVKAWKTGGSKMFIREGTQVPVGELLRGVIIQSGNDASVALAEHVAGSEDAFADIMNQYADILGLENTHFENATGLPSELHYSSAKDMALLANAIINDNPDYYPIYAEPSMTYNDIKQDNRNTLLLSSSSFMKVDGLKTGHTEEAGYCLVSSAVDGDMRLITAVFGTSSAQAREQETKKLLTYGFRYFETYPIYAANSELTKAKVWFGAEQEVSVGVIDELIVTGPKGEKETLNASIEMNPDLEAPIAYGQEVGTLTVTIDGKVVATKPVVALQAVEEGGFFRKIWDSIVKFFADLF